MKSKLKKWISTLCLICSLFTIAGCDSDDSQYLNTREIQRIPRLISVTEDSAFETIANNIAPAIVAISCDTTSGTTLGSGVCVYSGGYILTNEHVIEDATDISLYLYNGDTASAITLWSDSNMDIAILKSDVALPYLPLNEDSFATGEDVMAVGTPLNLIFTHTFTKGIISAVNRTLEVEGTNGVSYMQNLIQHDASINPGNSGGPLVNATGEIIGINTLKVTSAEGLGFAIPTKSFENVIMQVVNNAEYETPYFGILGYDADIAVYYGENFTQEGVYVEDVDTSSPAYLCGIRNGDIITNLNGTAIVNMLDLKSELYKYNAGDTLSVTFVRESTTITGSCTLVARS